MVPPPGAVLWSILSIVGLLAGIGGMVWWYASQEKALVHGPYPEKDPFLAIQADALAARHHQVFLRRGHSLGRADSDGHADRALRG